VPSLYRLHFGVEDRQLSCTADEIVHSRQCGHLRTPGATSALAAGLI
jgi:hypothetical protein